MYEFKATQKSLAKEYLPRDVVIVIYLRYCIFLDKLIEKYMAEKCFKYFYIISSQAIFLTEKSESELILFSDC